MLNIAPYDGKRRSGTPFPILLSLIALFLAGNVWGQSTFGTVVGTVVDPSGSLVPDCIVKITNTGTTVSRSALTDAQGSYIFVNIDPGLYELEFQAAGFQGITRKQLELTAKQTARVDAALSLAAVAATVEVTTAAEVINSEVSTIAETKSGRELLDLPVAIASRAAGSTSPITSLTTQPGVQTDASGNLSVAGNKPSMLDVTLDGINTQSAKNNAPIAELFPSFEGISEIRVSEINNTAEFGGVSNITTISKSGSNKFHGGMFENLENKDFNAKSEFSATKPQLIMNNFGASLGGTLSVPRLYKGKDRTFFYMDYEGLRLPQATTSILSVPTAAIRSGNLAAYLPKTVVMNPTTGTPFAGNIIPPTLINPYSTTVENYFFPQPNYGPSGAVSNNYIQNFPTSVSSNQGDMRLDQNISSRQTFFARFTYKRREYFTAPSGTPIQGDGFNVENDYNLAGSYNFIVSPNVLNELRVGLSGQNTGTNYGYTSQSLVNLLGLVLPQAPPVGAASPTFAITGFTKTASGGTTWSAASTLQILDNLSWHLDHHTIKWGVDMRYQEALFTNPYSNTRMGTYTFDNSSVTSSAIGSPYAAFLLGIPDVSQIATVPYPTGHGYGWNYGFYVLDDFHVTQKLTINYGLRYEWHPQYNETIGNLANFDFNYVSYANGAPVAGAFVIPDHSQSLESSILSASVAPTPFITASQVGLPPSLRYASRNDFDPRVGFAWRITNDGKTVLRGGWGVYTQALSGSATSAGWSLPGDFYGNYNNAITNGKALYTFPYPFPSNLSLPGTYDFINAVTFRYQDAQIQQWSMTIERDIGFNTGIRISYDGNHGSNLGYEYNADQVAANTIGYANLPTSATPFPLLSAIGTLAAGARSNYDAATITANRRFSKGLQFQSSYAFSKNLSNQGGADPTAFASEGGGTVTDPRNLNLDYGNVAFTRRNRFQTTFLYAPSINVNNALVRHVANGWELAGVALWETGPFLTVITSGPNPAGLNPATNSVIRADVVPGVALYPANQGPSLWINPAAFVNPPNNIGRFGDSAVGSVVGPGTTAISLSMFRSFQLRERARLRVGVAAANILNHPNYAVPNLTSGTAAFGTITAMQGSEAGGPRSLMLTGRINF